MRNSLVDEQEPIRVLVLGTGQMGTGIARLVLAKPGLTLVGAYGRRVARAGMDIGRAIEIGHDLGMRVSADLPALLEHSQPHVAIQVTCSRLVERWRNSASSFAIESM